MRAVKYFFGFLVGLGLGLSLGLLFAPQSGEKWQSQVRKKIEAIVEEGRRAAEERRGEMQAQFLAAKERR